MDRQQCPQCNSDLTCFQVLDALMEQRELAERGPVEREPVERGPVGREPLEQKPVRAGRSWKVWLPVAIVVVFLIGGLGWVFYQNVVIIQTLKDNHKSLEYVDRSVQALVRKVESGKAEVESGKQKDASGKQSERETPPVNISKGASSEGLERMPNNAKIQEEVPGQRNA